MIIFSRHLWPVLIGRSHRIIDAHRDNRMCDRCAAPGDCHLLRGARVEIGTFDPPPGTPVRLLPGEWSHCAGRDPGETVDLHVLRVHIDRAHSNDQEVWVTGHLPECSWQSAERHPPCVELLARVEALLREARTRARAR
ncbi:hypothetical protein [Micromonospora sp. NPDC004704]